MVAFLLAQDFDSIWDLQGLPLCTILRKYFRNLHTAGAADLKELPGSSQLSDAELALLNALRSKISAGRLPKPAQAAKPSLVAMNKAGMYCKALCVRNESQLGR